jgi:hypothetical protein
MNPTCRPSAGYRGEVAQQWMAMVLCSAGWFAATLDPRPDLSVPARVVRLPYTWWW